VVNQLPVGSFATLEAIVASRESAGFAASHRCAPEFGLTQKAVPDGRLPAVGAGAFAPAPSVRAAGSR